MKTMFEVALLCNSTMLTNASMFHHGTPPLKVLRMLLALATSKGSHRQKVCGIWDVSVAFFHSPMDEFTVVRPPGAVASAWQAMGSEESIVRHSDGQQVFWEIGW